MKAFIKYDKKTGEAKQYIRPENDHESLILEMLHNQAPNVSAEWVDDLGWILVVTCAKETK